MKIKLIQIIIFLVFSFQAFSNGKAKTDTIQQVEVIDTIIYRVLDSLFYFFQDTQSIESVNLHFNKINNHIIFGNSGYFISCRERDSIFNEFDKNYMKGYFYYRKALVYITSPDSIIQNSQIFLINNIKKEVSYKNFILPKAEDAKDIPGRPYDLFFYYHEGKLYTKKDVLKLVEEKFNNGR